MMYPRLRLCRDLLADDGVFVASIDEHEHHHLRLLLDDIFGPENFVAELTWLSTSGGGIRPKHVSKTHKYLLLYAREKTRLGTLHAPLSDKPRSSYKFEDENGAYGEWPLYLSNLPYNANQDYAIACPDGTKVQPPNPGEDGCFRFVRATFEKAVADGLVVFRQTRESPLVTPDGGRARWNIYIKKYFGEALRAKQRPAN